MDDQGNVPVASMSGVNAACILAGDTVRVLMTPVRIWMESLVVFTQSSNGSTDSWRSLL
jgi:hypothetical protein